jgi:hypothetical protein
MDTATRDEVAAAAAAHRELGADYGGAVAEGLVERIGAELDKRIDARLSQRGQAGLSALCVPLAPAAVREAAAGVLVRAAEAPARRRRG